MANSDADGNDTTGEEQQADEGKGSAEVKSLGDNPASTIDSYANDKSKITIANWDPNDSSFTTKSKTLYSSDENGKKLTVVHGLKSTPNG